MRALLVALVLLAGVPADAGPQKGHFLYVATPGIRNYVEYGGVGVLVFDIDDGYRFVKRIPTFEMAPGQKPENVKGVAASARTGLIYVSTPARIAAFDLVTEKPVWNRMLDGGCDRMALSPDGELVYVPSFEGPHWTVVNARTGDVIAKVETNSGAHNTIYGADGRVVYLAGLKSPMLKVAETATHRVAREVGPFGASIRPFTVNGRGTLAFVNVNELLGFEVGDLRGGRVLHRVEVTGYQKGPVKRHGCPSHGVGLTPDEKELWLTDAFNQSMHVFDATAMPPRQVASIRLRDQPGWITFSLDGKHAWPSTGEVVDTKTRRIVATLTDEEGRAVQSEKVVEVFFANGKPVRTGDQFGIGRRR